MKRLLLAPLEDINYVHKDTFSFINSAKVYISYTESVPKFCRFKVFPIFQLLSIVENKNLFTTTYRDSIFWVLSYMQAHTRLTH